LAVRVKGFRENLRGEPGGLDDRLPEADRGIHDDQQSEVPFPRQHRDLIVIDLLKHRENDALKDQILGQNFIDPALRFVT
jgi:hypothetical protein